jgi:hypothetical protein
MIHANYYEPQARMFRAAEAAHYTACSDCGRDVCSDYAKDEDALCPFNGDYCSSGYTLNGRVLCSYCA